MTPKAPVSSSLTSLSQAPPPAPFSSFISILLRPPPYFQIPHTNSRTSFPFSLKLSPFLFLFDLVRTGIFKIKPSKDLEVKSFISYTPWTKTEL